MKTTKITQQKISTTHIRSELLIHIRSESDQKCGNTPKDTLESHQAHLKAPVVQSMLIVKRLEILPQRIYIFNKKEFVTHKTREH